MEGQIAEANVVVPEVILPILEDTQGEQGTPQQNQSAGEQQTPQRESAGEQQTPQREQRPPQDPSNAH